MPCKLNLAFKRILVKNKTKQRNYEEKDISNTNKRENLNNIVNVFLPLKGGFKRGVKAF